MSERSGFQIPHWTARQVALATLFVVVVVVLFWLVYQLRAVVFMLFVGLVLGTAIRPAVDWFKDRGLSRAAGVLLIYLLLLLFVVGFAILVVPLIANQATAIIEQVPEYYGQLRTALITAPNWFLFRIGAALPESLTLEDVQAPPEEGPATTPGLSQIALPLRYATIGVRALYVLFAVFLLGFYWTLESEYTIRYLLLLLPTEQRENIRSLITEIEDKVGGYVRAEGTLMVAVGSASLVAYMLIGLPYALVLGLIAGLTEAIPIIGPTLGAIPAALLALSIDPSKLPWVIVAAIAVQSLENYILLPRVMRHSLGFNPIATLLALAAFTSLFGLFGALLAVPLTAIIQVLVTRYMLSREEREKAPPESRDEISVLRYEVQSLSQDVRKRLQQKETPADRGSDQIEDAIEAIANDLDRLLEQTPQATQRQATP